jgi:hypothetical protein
MFRSKLEGLPLMMRGGGPASDNGGWRPYWAGSTSRAWG